MLLALLCCLLCVEGGDILRGQESWSLYTSKTQLGFVHRLTHDDETVWQQTKPFRLVEAMLTERSRIST